MANQRKTEPVEENNANQLSGMLDEAFQGHEAYGEKPPEERTSRVRESRDGDVIHEPYDDDWMPAGLLDTTHIPARPGFVQRWVRTKMNGVDDPKNVMKKMNQGFRPRKSDTVPKGVFAPTINSRQYGDIVGMDGVVLMERPEHQHARHARHNRAMADRQIEAVNQMLHKAQEPNKGFGPVKVDTHSDVSTGHRPAPVSEDD